MTKVATLIITRGLPGSGKTTRAKAWVALDPANRVRVNRDDIRAMMNDSVFLKGETEKTAIAIRDAAIQAGLGQNKDVICDDTNLPQRTARDLRRVADRSGANFEVWDLTYIDLDVILTRNSARTDKEPVPVDVIKDMYERFLKGRERPLPFPEEPEVPEVEILPYRASDGLLEGVYLCDIDGTVALMTSGRSPFDETRVHEDTPNENVVRVVKGIMEKHHVVFISARTAGCYDETIAWLKEHVTGPDSTPELYMREEKDFRKDRVVKTELFDKHIRGQYDVYGVFDDRKQVCEMWREMGLTVFQVDEGNF